MKVRFLYVYEGSSDAPLSEKLQELCVLHGADEAEDVSPDLRWLSQPVGHRVEDKLRASTKLEPHFDLIFVHRDEDGVGEDRRRDEIAAAAAAAGVPNFVPVIPVQATEAWLLLDEAAIRRHAYRPSGRSALNLPHLAAVERDSDPKRTLQEALLTASETRGRDRELAKRRFNEQRAALLRELDLSGPLLKLPAFQRLVSDLQGTIERLRAVQVGTAP